MKRIFAFVLCLTMLLSQMAMVADAARARGQSDLSYLEENGIFAEEGAVIDYGTPIGQPDDTPRYSPSVPKFVPEALYTLGLEKRVEEDNSPPVETDEDGVEMGGSQGTGPTHQAKEAEQQFLIILHADPPPSRSGGQRRHPPGSHRPEPGSVPGS